MGRVFSACVEGMSPMAYRRSFGKVNAPSRATVRAWQQEITRLTVHRDWVEASMNGSDKPMAEPPCAALSATERRAYRHSRFAWRRRSGKQTSSVTTVTDAAGVCIGAGFRALSSPDAAASAGKLMNRGKKERPMLGRSLAMRIWSG